MTSKTRREKMESDLEGKRIVKVRRLTTVEMWEAGWDENNEHRNPIVLILEDGTKVTASMDEEGNEGGAIFIQKPNQKGLYALCLQAKKKEASA